MHSADSEGETLRHLLMICEVINVTRARNFGRHQISSEDAPMARPHQDPELLETVRVGVLRLIFLRKKRRPQ